MHISYSNHDEIYTCLTTASWSFHFPLLKAKWMNLRSTHQQKHNHGNELLKVMTSKKNIRVNHSFKDPFWYYSIPDARWFQKLCKAKRLLSITTKWVFGIGTMVHLPHYCFCRTKATIAELRIPKHAILDIVFIFGNAT